MTPLGKLSYRELKAALHTGADMELCVAAKPWVFVRLVLPPYGVRVPGFAKCCYVDTFDREFGTAIARGRAVAEYAKILWEGSE